MDWEEGSKKKSSRSAMVQMTGSAAYFMRVLVVHNDIQKREFPKIIFTTLP